jgi:hypothetical protein
MVYLPVSARNIANDRSLKRSSCLCHLLWIRECKLKQQLIVSMGQLKNDCRLDFVLTFPSTSAESLSRN